MLKRTVVIRKNSSSWQSQTKRKNKIAELQPKKKHAAGFISPVFIVLACTAFSGLFYIYSVNQTAVKGVAIRNAEKEISQQKKDNENLRIREAELKSLYNIENATRSQNMIDEANVKYLEENPTMAMGKNGKK